MTLKAQGKPRSFYRHWVFSRTNQPCYVCGDTIVKDTVGGRRVYYCPSCQVKQGLGNTIDPVPLGKTQITSRLDDSFK